MSLLIVLATPAFLALTLTVAVYFVETVRGTEEL